MTHDAPLSPGVTSDLPCPPAFFSVLSLYDNDDGDGIEPGTAAAGRGWRAPGARPR